MPTLTVAAETTDPRTLTAVHDFALTLPEGDARAALEAVVDTLRGGRDIIVAGTEDSLTTSQAAKMLGVSRAHLYKVLDSGALAYSIVGARDRRVSMRELRSYLARTDELRRDSARRIARPREARAAAIDQM